MKIVEYNREKGMIFLLNKEKSNELMQLFVVKIKFEKKKKNKTIAGFESAT